MVNTTKQRQSFLDETIGAPVHECPFCLAKTTIPVERLVEKAGRARMERNLEILDKEKLLFAERQKNYFWVWRISEKTGKETKVKEWIHRRFLWGESWIASRIKHRMISEIGIWDKENHEFTCTFKVKSVHSTWENGRIVKEHAEFYTAWDLLVALFTGRIENADGIKTTGTMNGVPYMIEKDGLKQHVAGATITAKEGMA